MDEPVREIGICLAGETRASKVGSHRFELSTYALQEVVERLHAVFLRACFLVDGKASTDVEALFVVVARLEAT